MMKGITGFRTRQEKPAAMHRRLTLPYAHEDKGAQDRVVAKIDAMGGAFYAMSEDDYGEWLDALPFNEFLEFIALALALAAPTRS
jgi:hypothetical protein